MYERPERLSPDEVALKREIRVKWYPHETVPYAHWVAVLECGHKLPVTSARNSSEPKAKRKRCLWCYLEEQLDDHLVGIARLRGWRRAFAERHEELLERDENTLLTESDLWCLPHGTRVWVQFVAGEAPRKTFLNAPELDQCSPTKVSMSPVPWAGKKAPAVFNSNKDLITFEKLGLKPYAVYLHNPTDDETPPKPRRGKRRRRRVT